MHIPIVKNYCFINFLMIMKLINAYVIFKNENDDLNEYDDY